MSKLDAGDRDKLPNREFAFPKQRKEPLEDASLPPFRLVRLSGVVRPGSIHLSGVPRPARQR